MINKTIIKMAEFYSDILENNWIHMNDDTQRATQRLKAKVHTKSKYNRYHKTILTWCRDNSKISMIDILREGQG